jgi:acetyl-CoA carboxylase biotin carboxyl carrier protein
MNIEIVEYINELLKGTKIYEFTIERGDSKIQIKRNVLTNETQKESEIENKKEEIQVKEQEKIEEKRVNVCSPTVGIFYHGKTKLGPALVKLNSYVKKGSLLGVVYCVGTPENVVAPVSGTIVEILVSNRKPVEYNQPLFVIEKEGN